ncbi:fimbrial protein [Citrobacter braakii]|uniref:fimbrial protein n=1 Tax=Citrobacter braakii TaxID=57706 RepID=UPI00242E645C|nr:fimbrial protein [Citrobacter braakii]EGT0650800.1 fimbrial protein [Citrobacter braakii]WFX94134.1 fimbrial protein [Citrobacter braakii]WFY03176.1 fimbrial protein [Citrobacter braakii]WGA85360.1 fimbrial protein [Citrobacter braakii]
MSIKNSWMKNGIAAALLALSIAPVYAANGSCVAAGRFNADVSSDWTQAQNVAGTSLEQPTPLTGGAYQIDCDCGAGSKVALFYTVTSALSGNGQLSGFYHLNDNLDIKTEVDDIPGATAVLPTNPDPLRESGSYEINNPKGSVCIYDPAENRAPPVTIGARTRFTLYVTKPFLGELVIPDTPIAYVRAGWNTTTGYPKKLGDIAELHIQGRITVPQDCKINQGDVIQVDLGYINTSRFTTRNEMPDGYTPVNFDIDYDCGDTSSINNKMEMRIDGDDVLDQYTLVARRREADNTPDIGVRMARIDDTHLNIPFTNGLIGIHPSGQGHISLEAWPINLLGGTPAPGKFSGTATITVLVK